MWLIDAATFRPTGFIPTGPDAHGLYPSRDARYLYVTNRGNGSITVINFATKKIATTWRIPGGGSPDMGGLSPDGKVFWVSGRYNAVVYAISTVTGRLLAKIPVGVAAARAVRMAPAGPLLPGPYRNHPMSMPRLAARSPSRVYRRAGWTLAGLALLLAGLAGTAPAASGRR